MTPFTVACVDPQPTLNALCIVKPDGSILCVAEPLCTSGRNKSTQMCTWLNHHTEKITQHLDILFSSLDRDEKLIFCIEGQFKGKSMIGLEAFIKGWVSSHFTNVTICSCPGKTWKKHILGSSALAKEEYEASTWNEMLSKNVTFDGSWDLDKRKHDVVDAYLIAKYIINKYI